MTDVLEIPGLGGDQPPAHAENPAPAPSTLAGVGLPMTIVVRDTPAPQGSKRSILHRSTGRIVTIESGHARVQTWREAVKHAALTARQREVREQFDGPVSVTMTFTLARPKAHYRTGRNAHLLRGTAPAYPTTKPDLDKLQRSTLDALSAAGVWRDDSQVVHVDALKVYPGELPTALDTPGAVLQIRPLQEVSSCIG